MAENIQRYIDVLAELIGRSGLKKREIERRVGWSKSSLTKLLQGQWEIKLRQLLAILQAIEVEPLAFFRLVCEDPPITERLLQELGKATLEPILLPPAMSEDELERRIAETVERALRLRDDKSQSGE